MGKKGKIFTIPRGEIIILEKGGGAKNIIFWANKLPCKVIDPTIA